MGGICRRGLLDAGEIDGLGLTAGGRRRHFAHMRSASPQGSGSVEAPLGAVGDSGCFGGEFGELCDVVVRDDDGESVGFFGDGTQGEVLSPI